MAVVLILLSGSVNADIIGSTRETEKAAHHFVPPFKFTAHDIGRKDGRFHAIISNDLYHYVDGIGYGTIRLSDNKQIWRKEFQVQHNAVGLASNGRTLFVAVNQGSLLAVSPRTGKTLWSIPGPIATSFVAADLGTVYYEPEPGKYAAVDTATHKTRWQSSLVTLVSDNDSRRGLTIAGHDRLIAATNFGRIACIDSAKGTTIWEVDVNDATNVSFTVKDGITYCIIGQTLIVLNADGTQRWRIKEMANISARLTVGYGLVILQTRDGYMRVFSADKGTPLWKVRADNVSPLPLLHRGRIYIYTDACILAYTLDGKCLWRSKNDKRMVFYDYDTWYLYPRWNGLLLLHRAGYVDIRETSETSDEPSASEVNASIDLLRERPGLLDTWDGKALNALEIIKKSHQPNAIAFLIEQLAKPDAPAYIRNKAFASLAKTGTEAAMKAVIAAKDTSRTIPTIEECLTPQSISEDMIHKQDEKTFSTIVDLKKDKEGRSWVLLQHALLGSYNDLWIAQVLDGKCTQILFTGINNWESRSQDWLAKFVGNPELSKDSDGDGWTDLVEKRFGTDINHIDTDGDGLKDSQDRNPLTVPRELNEREQIIAAAFEACFRFNKPFAPVLVTFPMGIKPFELAGWNWVIEPQLSEEMPLSKAAMGRTSSIIFSFPQRDFFGERIEAEQRDDLILWSPDHMRARIHIIESCGIAGGGCGYYVELKKIDGKWVVISIDSVGLT